MRKLQLLALGVLLQTAAIAQVYQTEDGITVTLKKVKNVRDKGNLNSYIKITDTSVDKILVKCYIESNGNESVDVNSFALVDQENKLRYCPVDLLNYHGLSGLGDDSKISRRLLKTPFERQSPYQYRLGAEYDPKVRDTFMDYDMQGFENVESKLSLGPTRNPHCSYVYYSPTKLTEFTADFFYAVSRENISPSFDLYYKGKKLFEIGMP